MDFETKAAVSSFEILKWKTLFDFITCTTFWSPVIHSFFIEKFWKKFINDSFDSTMISLYKNRNDCYLLHTVEKNARSSLHRKIYFLLEKYYVLSASILITLLHNFSCYKSNSFKITHTSPSGMWS